MEYHVFKNFKNTCEFVYLNRNNIALSSPMFKWILGLTLFLTNDYKTKLHLIQYSTGKGIKLLKPMILLYPPSSQGLNKVEQL